MADRGSGPSVSATARLHRGARDLGGVRDDPADGRDEQRAQRRGRSADSRFNFGVNTVYPTLDDARTLTFAGADLASAVIMCGRPSEPITGVAVLTNDDVKADQARTLSSGKSTIDLIQVLLWFVAAGIIALMVYLTAVGLGALAGLAGLRRAIGVDPAIAFGGA